MQVKDISIFDYTYTLPSEKIAYHPLAQRDQSRLLVYRNNQITTDIYRNISEYLPSHSLVIFNNTKVVEARILFKKPSGGTIEIFCLEPHRMYSDITSAMLTRESVTWMCLIGGASKWKNGQILEKEIDSHGAKIILKARYVEKINDQFAVELSWSDASLSFAEILHAAGVMPLPPYIKRDATLDDAERYQTVYATHDGSVAAPTAGLHFTDHIFSSLHQKNITTGYVTLHVGAGTFKPVKSATMQEHEMHAEFIDVSLHSLQLLLDHADGYITAVGTTSLRTIESLYWLGVKCIVAPQQPLRVNQWDPYEIVEAKNITTKDALTALGNRLVKDNTDRIITTTQLLIAPGYRFKLARALVTNFHQPQSTLLLLVAAFIGEDWKRVYQYALDNDFRFLSYGDGCLLERH
jgi:S-adenosylmethionine:tRNA ribosyltransferase-isomerase